MPRNLGFEVAQADPLRAFAEIDFRDGDAAPLLALREESARVIVDAGDHPVSAHVFVRAADNINMVFASAGGGQKRIAAPDRPGDDLGAVDRELPGNFG